MPDTADTTTQTEPQETQETAQEAPEAIDALEHSPATDAAADEATDEADEDPETFPREYVVKLRDEAAKYRQRASDRDTLAERLHVALVTATGRLADPTDLAFDDAHLADDDALAAAIDDLLARKPHLASRKLSGDVGQGATLTATNVDLAGMLRRNAS